MVGKTGDRGSAEISERTLETLTLQPGEARARIWDTQLKGFGVVRGKRQVTFIVFKRVKGTDNKITVTLGHWAPTRARAGDEGIRASTISVATARGLAIQALGEMQSRRDPRGFDDDDEAELETGPTLREGLKLHVSNMRKEGCSERSIDTIESEVPRLLPEWMDRSITKLTGVEMVNLHTRLTDEGKPYLANRIVAQVSAIWNATDRVHELEGRNPARAVTRNRYTPSRERVDDLAAWWGKVQTLENHVRRDLNVFCLFTGMRSEAARHARWEHVNLTSKAVGELPPGSLYIPKPKGGEDRAFTVPLGPRMVEMLKARRQENGPLFAPYGGDGGWIFPSLTRSAPYEVIPVAEAKEYRQTGGREGPKTKFLPGLHTLRRTYLSVAAEAGISELDRHVLANHSFGRQNVNETYIKQAFDHLAQCQVKIEAALWARCETKTKARPQKRGVQRGVVIHIKNPHATKPKRQRPTRGSE